MSRLWLAIEFVLLFVLLPVGYRFSPKVIPALPVLWVAALYCWWQLSRDAGFSREMLWNAGAVWGSLGSILGLFAVGALAIWLGVRLMAPELLFGFVRTRPGLWAVVMVLYPVLSVYPQGIIYRAFLMHRYAGMVSSPWVLIFVSAAAFAWMHLIFRNPVAVGLTFLGGVIFAWRYQATGSLFTSSVEHALYGCWLFTVGLGQYFYHGRVRVG